MSSPSRSKFPHISTVGIFPVGVPPIMVYKGGLCSKGVPFSGLRYIKGKGFHKLMWKGKWLILNRSILWLYSFHSLHTTWKWQEDFFLLFIMRAGYESIRKGCHFSLKVIGKRYLFVQNSIQGHGVGSQSRAFPYRLLYGTPPPPPRNYSPVFFPTSSPSLQTWERDF